jgi:hypothetical protein
VIYNIIFFNGSTAPWGPRPPHFSMLHEHTHFRHTTVGRTPGRVTSPSQRPLPNNTQHSQETDIFAPGGIRTHNPNKQTAVHPRLRPQGHWDRLQHYIQLYLYYHITFYKATILCKCTKRYCCLVLKNL